MMGSDTTPEKPVEAGVFPLPVPLKRRYALLHMTGTCSILFPIRGEWYTSRVWDRILHPFGLSIWSSAMTTK